MSNKERLQANNTQLAALIQALQGKSAGGGGGTLNYFFYIFEEMVTLPDNLFGSEGWKAAWICPLDEIDFDTATFDNLDILYGFSDGTELAIAAPLWQVLGIEKSEFSYVQANHGHVAILYASVYGSNFPVLLRMTEEGCANVGIEGEPGIYALNNPLLGMPGPAIMMRIGS